MTKIEALIDKARSNVSVREVFGEPYERNGVTLIPVARIRGIGGGGGGTGTDGEGEGSGMGYGMRSEPVGVYVISGDSVRFEPAVNVNRIVAGSFAVAIVGIVWAPRILKQARKIAALEVSRRR